MLMRRVKSDQKAALEGRDGTGAPSLSIPPSSTTNDSPGPHVGISPDSISKKPNLHSPPFQAPKSPMPPTAHLGASRYGGDSRADTPMDDTKQSSSIGTDIQSGVALDHAIMNPSPPPEVEATISKLTSHSNVLGVLVLSRPEALVIRSGGAYFEPMGPGARERAMRLKNVVEMVRNSTGGLERDVSRIESGVC